MPLSARDLSPALRKQLGIKVAKPHKYRAKPETIDGVRYDSQKEAKRAGELRWLVQAGEITDLRAHPVFDLVVNDVLIGRYEADFQYRRKGRLVVEDVKGVRTPVYRLKKKLMKAVWGIEIHEV